MKLTDHQKETVRAQVNTAAQQGAQAAAEQAKKATGWQKWAWALLAGLLAGLALFTQAQCSNVTDTQLQRAHDAYHVLTGSDCIFILPTDK